MSVQRLSDGERDSLYLALRLAAIEQHALGGTNMPLLLDDILINLENRRATAALKVLSEVAESTQVILFTHHPHIAELASNGLAETEFSLQQLVA